MDCNCIHEQQIESEGFYVCVDCGLVVDKILSHDTFSKNREFETEQCEWDIVEILYKAHIPEYLTKTVHRKFYEISDLLKKRRRRYSRDAIICFAIYSTLRDNNIPRTNAELAHICGGININKVWNIASEINDDVEKFPDYIAFLHRYCSLLNISYGEIKEMEKILHHVMRVGQFSPGCASATTIYLYAKRKNNITLPTKEIANTCNVYAGTVYKVARQVSQCPEVQILLKTVNNGNVNPPFFYRDVLV